jgi:hypothetical protein
MEVKGLWRQRCLGPFLLSTRQWMAPYRRLLEDETDGAAHAFRQRLKRRVDAGLVGIGVTILPSFRPAILTQFDTIKDLCYAITCSERILPFYRRPGYINGHWVVDGALSIPFVELSDPSSTITISPWTDSSADIKPQQAFRYEQLVRPPTKCEFISQFQQGYRDAARAQHVLIAKGLAVKGPHPPIEQTLDQHIERIGNKGVEGRFTPLGFPPSRVSMENRENNTRTFQLN